MQKRRLNIKAVKKAIDEMFTEIVKKTDIKETDKILPTTIVLDGVEYVYRLIDTRKEKALNKLAETYLEIYLNEHPDNTEELFIEVETEKAKEYQTYFPNYPFNNENYYFALQRWINVLQNLLPKQQETDNPDVKKNLNRKSRKP